MERLTLEQAWRLVDEYEKTPSVSEEDVFNFTVKTLKQVDPEELEQARLELESGIENLHRAVEQRKLLRMPDRNRRD